MQARETIVQSFAFQAAAAALWLAMPGYLFSEQAPVAREILERLERLEQQNSALREEIRTLRGEVQAMTAAAASAGPPAQAHPASAEEPRQATAATIAERVAIHDEQIKEQEQTKVEAAHGFPVRLTGMVLFNAFLNGPYSGGLEIPVAASVARAGQTGGGSFEQSMVGFQYRGPETVWGGKIRGYLNLDFYGRSSTERYGVIRIRTAAVALDWRTRTLTFGQEKPLIAPREPASLAQVAIPPLSGAGNLWGWDPQVRFEQRLALGGATSLRAQGAVIESSAENPYSASAYVVPAQFRPKERQRPAYQGRLELSHRLDDTRRLEFASGFHASTNHVSGTSLSSSLFSLDWFLNPWAHLEVSGAFFTGQNINQFGGPNASYSFVRRTIVPVHSRGGWSQFTFLATNRLSFNFYGGTHDDRNAELLTGDIGRNIAYAGNLMYRVAPNVLFSMEALQFRTNYVGSGARINNRYDVGIGYLF